jgi:hypothetical protein
VRVRARVHASLSLCVANAYYPDQVDTDLIVRELVLEVDSRFTSYALCNVCQNHTDNHGNNNCTNGEYTCSCHGGCNASIGARSCSRQFGHSSCHSGEQAWSCWRGMTAKKTVDGVWYSTLSTGLCTPTSAYCTWRVAEVVKRVSQQCLNGHIFDAVEAYNRSCFSGCGPTRNTTSDCWISCFYDGVLGTEVLTGGSITGIPLEQLDHAWLQSFRSDDPHAGGCPPIALPPPVNCFEKFKDRDSCDSNPQCS